MNTPTQTTSAPTALRAITGSKKTDAQRSDESMNRLYSSMVFNKDGMCDFEASCKKYDKAIKANFHWFALLFDRLGKLCRALDKKGMPRAAHWVSLAITFIAGVTPNTVYRWYYDLKHGAPPLTMRQHANSPQWKIYARLGFTMDEKPGFISRNFGKRYVAPVVSPDLQALVDTLCTKPKSPKRFYFF